MADELPERRQDFLGEQDDVVLVDESHLDVELSELGLAIGAEILVAVATCDLVVALDAADHEELLEQLRALRQCVEATGLKARRHQEVTGTLGRRARERRSLDLDELVMRENAARCSTYLGAQANCGAGAFTAQVEVAVLEARFFADLIVELERQRCAFVENLEFCGVDLDCSGGDLEVLVALGANLDRSGHANAVFRAQTVRLLGHVTCPENYLRNSGCITEIDEDHSAVITTPGYPTGERYGLLCLLGSQ